MSAIAVEALEFRHPGGFRLGPLTLSFPPGSRTAVAGPSGSGKTTLLRLLAGLERPQGGAVRFDSDPSGGGRPHPIGFVFQDGALWPHLTALGHLRFVAPRRPQRELLLLLERVGLGGLAARKPRQLSGGEAQRLALARALAARPRVLMLDEPLHNVDVHRRDDLCLLIRHLVDEHGLTLILVTHDREEALALADRLVVLRDGRALEEGAVEELLRRPRTAFAAEFLGRATCLPVRACGDGWYETPFGRLRDPTGNGTLHDPSLVLMPGDVRLGPGGAQGRVLAVQPTETGALARVELSGAVLRVPCELGVAPGTPVTLALAHGPRFLSRSEAEAPPP